MEYHSTRRYSLKGNKLILYVSFMEMFELRYFLGVARRQNIHRAAEDLHVSPASLSKAISRLESELDVVLFSRDGRNIRLTEFGKVLMQRASTILQFEESTRIELQGEKGTLNPIIVGSEVMLLRMGLDIAEKIMKRYPRTRFEFQSMTEQQALTKIGEREAHLAIVACDVPRSLKSKMLEKTTFKTCVGSSHPLSKLAKSGKAIHINEILEHPFVCPSIPLFGQVNQHQSPDGWRDDQFPRKVGYVSTSLRILEELVLQGKALAYLPDYHVETLEVTAIKVTGCPYQCEQSIRLVAKDPKQVSWMNHLFD